MNIRLFNSKGYIEGEDIEYYEVANEKMGANSIYVELQCGAGDFGLVMYGVEEKLLSDINILIGNLKEVRDELKKITLTTKQ